MLCTLITQLLLRSAPGQRRTGGTRNLRAARRLRRYSRRRCRYTFSYGLSSFDLIVQAVAADAGKAQLTAFYLSAAALSRNGLQGFGNIHIHQIDDCIAVLTDEVYVGLGVPVEPLHAFDCGHANGKTLLLEQVQVPVNRTHRQVGNFRLELGEDHFRRRVDVGAAQIRQDRIPLAEVLR